MTNFPRISFLIFFYSGCLVIGGFRFPGFFPILSISGPRNPLDITISTIFYICLGEWSAKFCTTVLHWMFCVHRLFILWIYWQRWQIFHSLHQWNSINRHCNVFWSWMYWNIWFHLYYQISDNDSTFYCGNITNITNICGLYCTGNLLCSYFLN